MLKNQQQQENATRSKNISSKKIPLDIPTTSLLIGNKIPSSNEKLFRIRPEVPRRNSQVVIESGFMDNLTALKKQPSRQSVQQCLQNIYYKRTSIKPIMQSSTLLLQSKLQPQLHQSAQNIIYNPTLNSRQGSRSQYFSGQQGDSIDKTSADIPIPQLINRTKQQRSNSQIFLSELALEVPMSKQDFKFIYVVGKGGFGKVWKVEHLKTKKLYAMKEMSKAKVISKRSVNSVLNERYLLKHVKHPFLVNMHYAFNDRENLFLVMDLLQGGDLRYHISKMKRFSESQTKFFIACILLPLVYLHKKGIIHRDLKPENLVLDEVGFLRLTDLGVAREDKGDNKQDTSGTPGYMAPEVMCRQEHSIQVDYYALGVIAHELMLGRRPYNGRARQEIREQILSRQASIKPEEIPIGWTQDSADFINKLIQRKPSKRLGATGPEEVMNHIWIKNFPFEKLLNKQLMSAYIPGQIDGHQEFQSYISEETVLNEEQQSENKAILRRNTVQQLFDGYYFSEQHIQPQLAQQQLNQKPRRDSFKKQTLSTSNSPQKTISANTINF